MGMFDFLKKSEEKAVPAVANISEATRNGLQKAYIPMFLYKPPFGYPRYVDLPNVRRLASVPYVEMCISTIIDEMCAVPWDIVGKDGKQPNEDHVKQVKAFFDNPNTNKESFEEIRRKYLRDILEVDSGVINKIFNLGGQMVEIVARDGATFTKNPDIYGMFTDRDDLIIDSAILPPNKESSAMAIEPGFISAADARERAAYFQYGWISGARPVPFGKKEIVWFERNPRTESIYGRSPVEVLSETIQTLIYAIEHNLEYFNDNSIPKGVLGFEGASSEEINAFKDQWIDQQRKKDTAGNWKKDFHNIPMVGKVPTYTRFEFTNAELELLEGQKWWAKLVWACFGVTSVELGYTEDAKGLANQIVQSNIFKKRTIYPLLRLEEYRLNQEIISEFEFDDIEFKFILFDVEEETKKATLYKLWLDTKLKSVNEIRQEEGLDPVEWGDKPSENNPFGNNLNQNPFGNSGKEEADKKEELQKKKEQMNGEEKSIEGKPGMGHSDKWWEIYHALIKEGHSKESAAKIANSKEEKSLNTMENPLIMKPGETMDDARLKRAMVYVLRDNEKKLQELIEREVGQNTIKEIKSVDDIAKKIKSILVFEGIKEIADAVIKNTFMQGWESAEKQLDKNVLVNKIAIDYIQSYTFNNIKGLTDELMTDLRQELERGIMGGEGIAKIKDRIKKVFDTSETRAEAIARTETSRAENQGKLQAFKTSGAKLKKQWVSAMDDRTSEFCKRMHGKTVGMEENFVDSVTGWEGNVPPGHVNCRSTVIYLDSED
jgi:SPP1 gp7 family putative phage head morphogenesis protein